MRISGNLERRIVMTIGIAALVPAFAIVHLLVARYRDQRQSLAREWSAQGERDLDARPGVAITEFETALAYGPDRSADRFRLAQALLASQRLQEARAQLLTAWSEEPGNGQVNLALARVAVGEDDTAGAIRYYHAAIDGAWETSAGPARRAARIELAQLLMSKGQAVAAQAELIALIGDLPPDAHLVTDVGSLLVDAGAPARALSLFRRALSLQPSDDRAPRLAGEVEFHMGDLRAAQQDLAAAAGRAPLSSDARDMLDVSERALAIDPYLDRLGVRARARRALHALAIAQARLARCQPGPNVDVLDGRVAAAAKRRPQDLERNADLIDNTMAVSLDVERLTTDSCGKDLPDDRALATIARRHPAAQ